MSEDLNEKQEMFCREFIVDFNATKAAIRAGYSEKSARQIASVMLTKHNISELIKELIEEKKERTWLTAEYIVGELRNNHEKCSQQVAVLDHDGEETGEYRFEHAGSNKALELMGKSIAMFTENRVIDHKNPAVIVAANEKDKDALLADYAKK